MPGSSDRSDHPLGGSRLTRFCCDAPVMMGAGDTFALNGDARAWLVVDGAVDLFLLVPPPAGAGIRRHLARILAGGIIMGVGGPADAAVEWIAVPLANTRLAAFRPADVAADAAFAPAFDEWVRTCAGAIAADRAPSTATPIESPGDFTLATGQAICGGPQRLWLTVATGSLEVAGVPGLMATADGAPWPLVDGLWFRSPGPGQVVVDAARATDATAIITTVSRVAEGVGAAYCAREQAEVDRQRARASGRLLQDQRSIELAETALVNVLGARRPDPAPMAADVAVEAVSFLTAHEHIAFCAPSLLPDAGLPMAARLDQLLRGGGLMWRRALLDEDWSRADVAAFLVIDADRDAPLVVYPVRSKRYRVFDAETGEHRPLDATVAAGFGDHGIVLSRPLPALPLSDSALLRFGLAGQAHDVWLLFGIGLLAGLIGLLTPLVTSTIVGDIIPDAATDQLAQYGGLLLGMTLSVGLFGYAQALTTVRMSGRLDNSIQTAVWDRLLRLPVAFFRRYTAGDLANRAIGINTINSTITTVTLIAVISGVFASLNFILMLWYAWQLALIGLALALVTLLATIGFTVRQLVWQRRATDMQGRLTGLALQLIGGINKLRVANAEDRAYSIWAAAFAEQNQLNLRAQRLTNALTVFNSVTPTVGAIVVFIAIAWLLGTIGISDFVAFNAAFGQFFAGTVGLSAAFASIVSIIPLYRRVKPILNAVPEVDAFKSHPGDLRGGITIDRLSFAYDGDDRLVLDNVSMSMEPGDLVAIVGPSGSGKSTLARLLIGFEQPLRGSIMYDDMDLVGLDAQALRRQLGVVVQNSQIMPGNIFQNIVGNHSELNADDAWAAAAMAGLDGDIRAMPMGMETFVSESGATFSAGQRQRLMIARAVAMRPRILIFDEATSALDNETQAIVTASLARLNATRIVIAQRLSTIINADQVYLLAGGRICQQGTCAELMREPGLFRDFIARQLL